MNASHLELPLCSTLHCWAKLLNWWTKMPYWNIEKARRVTHSEFRYLHHLVLKEISSLIIVAYGTWIWPLSELKAMKFFFFWLKATKFWPSSVDGSYCWTFYFVLCTYSLFSVIYYIETLQLKMTPIPSLVSNNSAKLQSSIEYNNSTK